MVSLVRRSPIKYVLPILLLFDIALVFSRGTPWKGQWLWTLDWAGAAIILVGPVAAGLTAWHARFQSRVFEGWQGVGKASYRAVKAVLVSDLILLELVHGAAIASALILTISANPIPGVTAFHGLLQFAVLAGYVSIGYLVGRNWDSPIVPPILTLVLYLLPALAGFPTLLVSYGGATSSLSGFSPNWSVDIAQAVVGLSLLAAALQVGFGSPPRLRLIVLALSVVALGSAVLFLATTKAERFQPSSTSHLCTSGKPTICVNEDIRFKLDEISELLLAVDRLERKLGVSNRPNSYIQATPGTPPTSKPPEEQVRYFGLSSSAFKDRGQLAFELLGSTLIEPRCFEIQRPKPWSVESFEVAANVLAYRLTQADELRTIPQVAAVLELPQKRVDGWLKGVLQAANDCSLRAIPPIPS